MSSILNWIKKNKLATVLLLIVSYFVLRQYLVTPLRQISTTRPQEGGSIDSAPAIGFGQAGVTAPKLSLPDNYPPEPDYTPQPDVANRLIIQESSLSLQVRDVVDARNKILEHTQANGGYMVNASTTSPEDTPFATVSIRIPSEKLQAALDYFHSLSVKVVSENLVGRDVTDQYIDIEKRIETYEKTRAKYEEILDRATSIQDITNLTREIINIQSQIDSLKGQQQALEQNAKLAKVTIYLSTDEIALPYAPSETFRPAVIFKLAVRSLIVFLRKLATSAIWLGVYSVIWIPAIVVYVFIRRWLKKKYQKQ